MNKQALKLVKEFTKDITKGKDVFYLSYSEKKSFLANLPQDTDIKTLLIHSKNNGVSSFSGHINKKHINNSVQNGIFLNLKDLSMPEVYIFDKENSHQLSTSLDDFIIIFCEFNSTSVLLYVFNTPYCTVGKKGISVGDAPLTNYHIKTFLNTLPEDKYEVVRDALYSDSIVENKEM